MMRRVRGQEVSLSGVRRQAPCSSSLLSSPFTQSSLSTHKTLQLTIKIGLLFVFKIFTNFPKDTFRGVSHR